MDTLQLAPHQYRVIREKAKLDEKLSRLRSFLASDHTGAVAPQELERMHEQADVMKDYSNILGRRIDYFNSDAAQGFKPSPNEEL